MMSLGMPFSFIFFLLRTAPDCRFFFFAPTAGGYLANRRRLSGICGRPIADRWRLPNFVGEPPPLVILQPPLMDHSTAISNRPITVGEMR